MHKDDNYLDTRGLFLDIIKNFVNAYRPFGNGSTSETTIEKKSSTIQLLQKLSNFCKEFTNFCNR